MLTRIIYTSIPVFNGDLGGDQDILTVARNRNKEFGITGYLLRTDELFLQFFEGPEDNVHQLMINIRKDARHRAIVEWAPTLSEKRAFPHWRMGYATTVGEEQFAFVTRTFLRHLPMEQVVEHLHKIDDRYGNAAADQLISRPIFPKSRT